MSRVQALLSRIVEHGGDPSTIKTCCGVLAILSRSEDKKSEVASTGLVILLQAMNTHITNNELVEAACDLLWTLAFNNKPIKASISAHGGISTLLRCVDIHRLNPTLLRSALGTLSNLSQLPENQEHIGVGLDVIVAGIKLHARNTELLAFALDTLTSIIIGHERNCRAVVELGVVGFLLDVLADQKCTSVLKSACHTLAILCDLSGVGKTIAEARGVRLLASSMAAAPLPTEVERILTVLLFRISKDPSVVAYMIQDGVIHALFLVLLNQGDRANNSETLLATCHILCLMTQHAVSNAIDLTPYAPTSSCHSDLLLRLATFHGTPLTLSIFRVLANAAKNPVPLLALVNVPTVEGMFGICLAHSNPPEMVQLTIDVVVGLPRSCIQEQRLRAPEKTLAALLACIRSFPDDIRLLDQVFCLATTYCLSPASTSSPRTVFGFIGAAMRFLSRFTTANWKPNMMIEACRFLLTVMTTKEGLDSVVSCGGVNIFNQFSNHVFKLHGGVVPGELHKLLHGICLRLETPCPNIPAPTEHKNQDDSSHILPGVTAAATSSPHSSCHEDEDEDDIDGGGGDGDDDLREDDDDGEDDGSEEEDDEIVDVDAPQVEEDIPTAPKLPAPAADVVEPPPVSQEETPTVEALVDFVLHTHPNPQDILPHLRSQSSVIVERFAYVNPLSGCKLPRHPLKPLSPQPSAAASSILVPTCPLHNEPATCTFADAQAMQTYIDERVQARLAFIANDSPRQLVYQSQHPAGDSTMVSHIPPVYPYAVPFPSLSSPLEQHLTFDSEFDGGNLLRAVQIGPFEYDLVLRPDLHTLGYTQWFYFAVANAVAHVDYTFHIVNLYKPDSLFNSGLQPVVYSVESAETQALGWYRAGRNVCYYANPWLQPSKSSRPDVSFYTLSFTLSFASRDDTYLVAHSYPYTMHDHRWHLLQPQFHAPAVVRRSLLARTLGRLDCDLLTITDFDYQDVTDRPVIVLTARVHPGEPQASWVMRGTIDFLVSDAPDAKLLRRLFVFKVVPVLNPDGVFYGNNRCGLAACDLNRQWKSPWPHLHPTISAVKALMLTLPVVFYCDIHGHSRKKNVFMYGCDSRKVINPTARTFPRLLSQQCIGRKYVSLAGCSFQVHRGREATARVVVGRDLGIQNSFTLEASFCGADFGLLANHHFNLRHLDDIGVALAQTLLEYAMPEPIDRVVVYEWLQQPHEVHDVHAYIEEQYHKRDEGDDLGALVFPLHMTLAKRTAKVKKKKKGAKGTTTTQQQPQQSHVKPPPKLQAIKPTLPKKPPTKPKKEPKRVVKLVPPPSLKKALSLPSPKTQLREAPPEPTKQKTSPAFRRLTLFNPPRQSSMSMLPLTCFRVASETS
ncbi:hypothetical protein AC1031_014863 [Aphanomyces cochlioides]|nr:hypothetical protein AC1031_014863 [Aphanomyces cochlioides]